MDLDDNLDDNLDDERDQALDAAIQRVLHVESPAPDPDRTIESTARREALEHVEDPDLEADMAAVDVPMDELMRAAGLAEQPVRRSDVRTASVSTQSWLDTIREWLWSPRFAYAAAACVLAVVVFKGRSDSPEKMALQQVALTPSELTRSAGPQDPEQALAVVLDAGVAMVDLRAARSVDPERPIRYRAILKEISDGSALNVAYSSDNRRFAPGADGLAYPVYRVPSHLLRKGYTYELVFQAVDANGENIESGTLRYLFRIAE